MYTPLRYQATPADCYPTSVLNALVWLFERHELPGLAVQRIYTFCLDGIERGIAGSYTSEHAALALADWLSDFRTPAFAVHAEVVRGPAVNLRPAGKMLRAIRHGGVAVLDLCDTDSTTHSVLALADRGKHLDVWDPYVRGPRYAYGGADRLESAGRAPNLRIAKHWLDSAQTRSYSLGAPAARTAVLISRARRSRSRRHTP